MEGPAVSFPLREFFSPDFSPGLPRTLVRGLDGLKALPFNGYEFFRSLLEPEAERR